MDIGGTYHRVARRNVDVRHVGSIDLLPIVEDAVDEMTAHDVARTVVAHRPSHAGNHIRIDGVGHLDVRNLHVWQKHREGPRHDIVVFVGVFENAFHIIRVDEQIPNAAVQIRRYADDNLSRIGGVRRQSAAASELSQHTGSVLVKDGIAADIEAVVPVVAIRGAAAVVLHRPYNITRSIYIHRVRHNDRSDNQVGGRRERHSQRMLGNADVVLIEKSFVNLIVVVGDNEEAVVAHVVDGDGHLHTVGVAAVNEEVSIVPISSHTPRIHRAKHGVGSEIDHVVPGAHGRGLTLVGDGPRQRNGAARESVGGVRHAAHHQVG